MRVICWYASPWAWVNVTEMPSSRAMRSARSASSFAISSCASFSAASTAGPAELARATPEIGAT